MLLQITFAKRSIGHLGPILVPMEHALQSVADQQNRGAPICLKTARNLWVTRSIQVKFPNLTDLMNSLPFSEF